MHFGQQERQMKTLSTDTPWNIGAMTHTVIGTPITTARHAAGPYCRATAAAVNPTHVNPPR